MENYEKFVQCHLNHLRKSEEEPKLSPSPSLIRFHGKPILPPLLSAEQREEMQLHREAAQKTGVHRKIKEKRIKDFVQNVLDTVQLRNSPTLDNFLQELHLNKNTVSHNTTDESSTNNCTDLPCSPMPKINGKDCDSQTSPASSSALCPSSVNCQNKDESLRNHRDDLQDDQSSSLNDPSHLSISAGDSTQPEGGNYFSEIGVPRKQFLGYVSSEQSYDTDEFLGHGSWDMIAKMPNIINYPPIDAEELERSDKELSLCCDFIAVKDICSSSFKRNRYLEKASRNSSPDCQNVSTFKALEFDVPPDHHPAVVPDQNITQIAGCSVSEDKNDSQSSEKPQRRSLQALLQKSQEYRRQQRMLRNQAKNTKTQERSTQQPRGREQSPSDKENDQIPCKKAVSEWRRNLKEKRNTLPSSVAVTNRYSGKKCHIFKDQRIYKKVDSDQKCSKKGKSDVHRETLKNKTLNISPRGINETKQVSLFCQQRPKTSLIQDSFSMNIEPSDSSPSFFSKARKRPLILAPTFSKSAEGSDISNGKTRVDEVQAVDETSTVGHEISSSSSSGVKSQTPQSSPHTYQIESELSSPNDVVSAESTVATNTEDQTEWGVDRTGTDCGEGNDYESQNYRDWTGGQPKHHGDGPYSIHGESGQEQRFSDEAACESLDLPELKLVKNIAKERKKLSNQGVGCDPQQRTTKRILSLAQWKRVPDVFRNSEFTAGAHSGEHSHQMGCELQDIDGYESSSSTLDQSCGLNKPSEPSLIEMPRSDPGSITRFPEETRLMPDNSGGGESGTLKVKRRLLMHETEEIHDPGSEAFLMIRPDLNRVSAALGGLEHQEDPIEQLKQIHAQQIRDLLDQHRTQQRDLLQALTMRCSLPQSVSFPRSRLEDKVTLAAHSRPFSCLPEHHRPLLLAAVKGFLTRRLLKTETVAQLVRTIRDMQTFLRAFQQQSSSRGEIFSRQDWLLQARVAQQLQAARYDVYDIFFSLTVGERMQLISSDRELVREKQFRHQGVNTQAPGGGKKFLSAATRKSLERKREVVIQKTAAKCNQGNASAGHKNRNSSEQLPKPKRGQFRANPQRDSKNTNSSRLR